MKAESGNLRALVWYPEQSPKIIIWRHIRQGNKCTIKNCAGKSVSLRYYLRYYFSDVSCMHGIWSPDGNRFEPWGSICWHLANGFHNSHCCIRYTSSTPEDSKLKSCKHNLDRFSSSGLGLVSKDDKQNQRPETIYNCYIDVGTLLTVAD